ncbi:MAG TPA: winged helix-turn-helix domain-containing protein [Tepidiformaceae bacterium]|nr:winged helix-turn-helix domain-containing protein [Tepidiformaceae bacterium]
MNLQAEPLTIDGARRELRVGARVIDLEPRVFDLVAYLAARVDRVVPKDELLDAVWPDLDVGDGSLQRAVSVARAALRDAGVGDPIRTFARRGYRFCIDSPVNVSTPSTRDFRSGVACARSAYDAGDWQRAASEFSRNDGDGALGPQELELYGQALLRSGSLRRAPAVLERAVGAYVAAGDRKAATQAAVVLGMVHWQCEDMALARGWQRRAASLMAGEAECHETGLVAWLDAFIRVLDCDFEEGIRRALDVYEMGGRLNDPELLALGRAFSAIGLLAMNRPEAAELLDEAATAVVSGEASHWVGSHILCGTLWGYRNVADWDRASQWANQYVRWCERTGMWNTPGTWRLHRVEVLANSSDLDAALKEALALPAMLAEVAPWAVGDAWRVIGEMLVAQQDLPAAQSAFEEAEHLGWAAQPGLALLHLGRGRPQAAVRSLERALKADGLLNRQRRPVLEGYLVLALAAAGSAEEAAALVEEIVSRPDTLATPALQALVARGRAEIAALKGRFSEAVGEAALAAQRWSAAGSPFNEAKARLRLAQLLLADSDFDGADVEAGVACRLASRLNAHALASGCDVLRAAIRLRDNRLLAMPELGSRRDEPCPISDITPEQMARLEFSPAGLAIGRSLIESWCAG